MVFQAVESLQRRDVETQILRFDSLQDSLFPSVAVRYASGGGFQEAFQDRILIQR